MFGKIAGGTPTSTDSLSRTPRPRPARLVLTPFQSGWVALKIGCDMSTMMQARTQPFSWGRVMISVIMAVRSASGEGQGGTRSGWSRTTGRGQWRRRKWVRLARGVQGAMRGRTSARSASQVLDIKEVGEDWVRLGKLPEG